jgi:hypothetical protein
MPNEVDLPVIAPGEALEAPSRRAPGPSKLAPINPVEPLTERPKRLHRGARTISRGYTGPWESGIDVSAALSERATLFVHLLCSMHEQRGHGFDQGKKGLALIVSGQTFRLRIRETLEGRMVVTFQPDRFSMTPAFRCSDRRGFKAEEYIADAIAAIEQKATWIIERSRELAEQSAGYAREEVRRSRRKRLHEFIRRTADALDQERKMERLLVRLKLLADPTGSTGVDRLARELHEIVEGSLRAFTRDALDAEIARLELFRDDE